MRGLKLKLGALLIALVIAAVSLLFMGQTTYNPPGPTATLAGNNAWPGANTFTGAQPQLSAGLNGGAAGQLSLQGSTSGGATITAPAAAGTSTNAVVSSNNFSAPALVSTVATGTAPFAVTSTTTVPNLTVSNHPKVQFCGATSTCSATVETSAQVVYGSAPLVSNSPSAVTIASISPAFTSTSSYKCQAADVTTPANTAVVTYVSGSSFTITSSASSVTDTVTFICTGY